MWLAWLLACLSAPVPAGPSARERFVADPPDRVLPAGERHLGGAQWGRPLPFVAPRPVAAVPERRASPSGPTVVALEGGRWAVRWRDVWTLWDPARGIVAERPADGWPTPDGAWLVGGSREEGPRRLDPAPVPGTRTAWIRRGTAAFQADWSDAAASGSGSARPTDKHPGATVVLPPKDDAAVTAADHVAVRDPDGERRRLVGCTDREAVYFAPGDAAIACRGDGAIVVHDRVAETSWSVPEALDPGSGASVSAAGEVVVHVVAGGPCVHHADGRTWAAPGISADRALVTDDGSLVVAIGDGLAIFDAATGARLDPPRDPARVQDVAVGPAGEIAVLAAGDALLAWDAGDAPLGAWSPPDDPATSRVGIRGLGTSYRRAVAWSAGSVCATSLHDVVCRDPRDGWRVTAERKGEGDPLGSHLVDCQHRTVDGAPFPDVECTTGRPAPAGDADHLLVRAKDAPLRPRPPELALDLATLTVGPPPPPARPPLTWISLAGGVHVVDRAERARPAADPLTPIPTRDVAVTLAMTGLPGWISEKPPKPPDVEASPGELRFRRPDGTLARIAGGGAEVAAAGDLLVVRTADGIEVISRADGSARTLEIPRGVRGEGASRDLPRLAVSPDGTRVAVSDGGVTRVLDVATLQEVASAARIDRVTPSPEGRFALVRRADGTAELLDLSAASSTPVAGLRLAVGAPFAFPRIADGEGHGAAALGPDGALLARRGLPWDPERVGLTIDEGGRVGIVAGGRRYAVDDAGRLSDLGAVVEDASWAARFPDARWTLPGRLGVPPAAAACLPSPGLACSAIPAPPAEPADIADLKSPIPSPDGRWAVGWRSDGRSVLRGPGGASKVLPKDVAVTWADAGVLVAESPGTRQVWREGELAGSTPGGLQGSVLAAGGGRVARARDRDLVVAPLEGGPATCVLPTGGTRSLVVSADGAFAAWIDEKGLWRADLVACAVVQRPPDVERLDRAPERPTALRERLAALGWQDDGGPLFGTPDHRRVGTSGERPWSAGGAAAWTSRGGVAWWGPGGGPRLCALPSEAIGFAWTHDEGLLVWSDREVRALSAATLAACPEFPSGPPERRPERGPGREAPTR